MQDTYIYQTIEKSEDFFYSKKNLAWNVCMERRFEEEIAAQVDWKNRWGRITFTGDTMSGKGKRYRIDTHATRVGVGGHTWTHVRIHDRTHAFLSLASRTFPTRGYSSSSSSSSPSLLSRTTPS